MNFRNKTYSGLIWTFSEAFLFRGISFLALLYLARQLGPTSMGIIGVIAVFISIGNALVDSGLSSSIIRTDRIDDVDLSTIFYLNLLIALIVYLIFYFSAPLISSFYQLTSLIDLIRVYCLTFIISSLSTVHLALLEREMQFKRLLKYKLPGNIFGAALGISLAYHGMGVWSIIFMYISSLIIQSIILWMHSGWSPQFVFSKKKMQFHLNFGYKLMLAGILDTIFKNINNLIIGRYFSLKELGFYDRANTMNEYPVSILTGIINKVSYPLLSKIQNDNEKLAHIYQGLIQVSFFITTPIMLITAALAKPLFLLILGEDWLNSVPLFKILCLASVFYPIHALNINILKVYGRSDLFLKLELIKKLVISISIFFTLKFGIVGLAWGGVFSSIFALIINTNYSKNLIDYGTKQQIIDLFPSLISSVMIYYIVTFFTGYLIDSSVLLQIILPGFTGISIYIIVHYLNGSKPLLTIKNIYYRK